MTGRAGNYGAGEDIGHRLTRPCKSAVPKCLLLVAPSELSPGCVDGSGSSSVDCTTPPWPSPAILVISQTTRLVIFQLRMLQQMHARVCGCTLVGSLLWSCLPCPCLLYGKPPLDCHHSECARPLAEEQRGKRGECYWCEGVSCTVRLSGTCCELVEGTSNAADRCCWGFGLQSRLAG